MKKGVIDSHIHIYKFRDNLMENLAMNEILREKAGIEAVVAASLPQVEIDSVNQNALCLLFKALYPHNYCYFGFDYHLDGLDTSPEGRLKQVKDYLAMGFDGLKIIEGKPDVRKLVGRSFLVDEYAKAFAYLEENSIPVLWHVADPEENWNKSKCNDFVIKQGWCYDSPEYPSKIDHINEALQMLDRYPSLNVTFAHFLFTSFDREYAGNFMEKYPKACLDLTPGIEMYAGFNSDRKGWREFFLEYQDRIIFGTDNGWGEDTFDSKIERGLKNIEFITDFLSTDKIVSGYNDLPVRGISLPEKVVDKFLGENFKCRKNRQPNKLNLECAFSYVMDLFEKINHADKYIPSTKKLTKQIYQELAKL